jgi:hypothetical protein
MGRESRVRRLRQLTSHNSITFTTAVELQQTASLAKRAAAAGLVLPTLKMPKDLEIIRHDDD